MAIQSVGRGRDTHLIKITLGYETGTRKRLYFTETFKGAKRDARLREAELKIQHRKNKLVLSSRTSFRESFDRYCDEAQSRLSINSLFTYRCCIDRYVLPSIGDKKLNELVKDDIQKIYDSMSARGLSPLTVRSLHAAVRSVITWIMKKDLLSKDILTDAKLPKIPKPRPEFLTYEEMQIFFDAARDYWYGNAFKFQFMTGLRNQELMALMWDDINFETANVLIKRACAWVNGKCVEFKSTKTREERVVALDPQTVDFLKRLKAAQEEHIRSRKSRGLLYVDKRLVFCTRDGRTPCVTAVKDCFKRILKKIGITRRFR